MTITALPGAPATVNSTARLELAERLTESAHTLDSPITPNTRFRAWFAEQRRVNQFEVHPMPFADLVGWRIEPDTGNLVHNSGRFFSIEGLHLRTDRADGGEWMQPIINQPEVGILGIVVKEFDGVLHCLMQAKMEPGNLNTVQLSPTVQATRSNYTGVHKGRATAYIDYFAAPRRSEVLVDVLQSEQASWFLRKRNRNMVVEVTEDVPLLPDFCWLTIGQIHALLDEDNLVNMDARTVLSCMPFDPPNGYRRPGRAPRSWRDALRRGMRPGGALHSIPDLLSWLTEIRAVNRLDQRSVPLNTVTGWTRDANQIYREDGKHFRVIAADVRASNREVTAWTQPLVAPVEQGIAAFLVREFDGVAHVLLQAKMESGVLNVAEFAPTVQCLPVNYADLPAERQPRFLDVVRAAAPDAVRADSVQSEEGGRFFHADNRYQIIEVGDEIGPDAGDEHRWVTPDQMARLLQHSNHLNIQARSLYAALHTTW